MVAFSRLAAVFVGLANLVALAGLDNPRVWKGGVALSDALPPVLGVVVAGLATSEIVLRWYRSSALAEKFSDRYGIMMFVPWWSTDGWIARHRSRT